MKERICIKCHRSYPLTEDYFYKNNLTRGVINFRTDCKECFTYENRIKYKLRKLKAEQAKKDAWKDEFKDKTFICKHCGKEKTFEQMRVNTTTKKVESRCKACFNEKHKEYKQNYDANAFIKSTKKER